MTRETKIPDATHTITIEPTDVPVTVLVGDTVIAETNSALTLREASYPPVQYIPLADVNQDAIRPTDTETYCPFKGEASYYSIQLGDTEIPDAIWTYREPYAAVSQIAGHVAFYPNKVEIAVG